MKFLLLLSVLSFSTICLAKEEIINFSKFSFDKKSSNLTNDSLIMFSNSSLTVPYTAKKAGNYQITIVAKGTKYHSEGAILELTANGVSVDKKEVKSTEFTKVIFTAALTKGANKLNILFINDAFDIKTKEDRNVFIQSVQIK